MKYSPVKGKDYIGVGVGVVIVNNEGKLFLGKRGPKARNEVGKWDFPGGSVEFGETPADAAVRETKEEFDFEIEVTELLNMVNHFLPEEGQHWISPGYVAKYISGEPKIMEPEKCSAIVWLSVTEVDPSSLTMTAKSKLAAYKEKYGEDDQK